MNIKPTEMTDIAKEKIWRADIEKAQNVPLQERFGWLWSEIEPRRLECWKDGVMLCWMRSPLKKEWEYMCFHYGYPKIYKRSSGTGDN